VFHQEIGDRVSPVVIAQKDGRLAYIEMEQAAFEAGLQVTDLGRLATSLGITPTDLTTDRLPCQVVSTGVAHLLVPIRNVEAVERIRPNGDELRSVLVTVGAEGRYAFRLEPAHNDAVAYARFFNPHGRDIRGSRNRHSGWALSRSIGFTRCRATWSNDHWQGTASAKCPISVYIFRTGPMGPIRPIFVYTFRTGRMHLCIRRPISACENLKLCTESHRRRSCGSEQPVAEMVPNSQPDHPPLGTELAERSNLTHSGRV
jgi:hypothetical protein